MILETFDIPDVEDAKKCKNDKDGKFPLSILKSEYAKSKLLYTVSLEDNDPLNFKIIVHKNKITKDMNEISLKRLHKILNKVYKKSKKESQEWYMK